jgi:site-specific recombinase XerD
MSEAAVAAILKQPDTNTEKGLRDQFIMILLYATGVRIQEMMVSVK